MNRVSVTKTEVFWQCKRRFHHQYILRDLPPEKPSAALLRGRDVHESLAARLEGKELPEDLRHVEPLCSSLEEAGGYLEVEQTIKLDESGSLLPEKTWDYHVVAILDVVVQTPEKFTFVDWKTGKVRNNDLQCDLYAGAILKWRPLIEEVSGWFVWVDQKYTRRKAYTREDADRLWEWVGYLGSEIDAQIQKDDWPAEPNRLCPWCPVSPSQCGYKK